MTAKEARELTDRFNDESFESEYLKISLLIKAEIEKGNRQYSIIYRSHIFGNTENHLKSLGYNIENGTDGFETFTKISW